MKTKITGKVEVLEWENFNILATFEVDLKEFALETIEDGSFGFKKNGIYYVCDVENGDYETRETTQEEAERFSIIKI